MQNEQRLLPWPQLSPVTDLQILQLLSVCLSLSSAPSGLLQGENKKDPAHTLTYVPGKGSCLRTELKPRWPTAPGTLSPPGWLLQLGLGQLVGVNESHPKVPCKSYLPLASSSMLPSYATWGYGFHSMTTRLNVGCSDRNVALHNQYLKSTTQIYFEKLHTPRRVNTDHLYGNSLGLQHKYILLSH